MRESIYKRVTVKVPVDVELLKGSYRGATWSAEMRRADNGGSWARTDGTHKTEADAKASIADVILATLAASDQRMVMVIGGSPDYADHVHLIQATARGVTVYAVHKAHGRTSASMSDGTVETQLERTLRHVGGEPTIVRL